MNRVGAQHIVLPTFYGDVNGNVYVSVRPNRTNVQLLNIQVRRRDRNNFV